MGKGGDLLYEDRRHNFVSTAGPEQFLKTIGLEVDGPAQWIGQDLPNPRLPVVRTRWRCGEVEMTQRAFSLPEETLAGASSPRQDVILVHLQNTGGQPATVTPVILVKSQETIESPGGRTSVRLGERYLLHSSLPVQDELPAAQNARKLTLGGEAMSLHARLRQPTGKWRSCGIVSKFGNLDRLIYNLYFNEGNLGFELGTAKGVARVVVPVAQIGESEWHDVTVRYDGAKLEMFVDGTRVGETPAAGALRPENNEPLVLGGASYNGRIIANFGGVLDTVALWKRALTESEVLALSGRD